MITMIDLQAVGWPDWADNALGILVVVAIIVVAVILHRGSLLYHYGPFATPKKIEVERIQGQSVISGSTWEHFYYSDGTGLKVVYYYAAGKVCRKTHHWFTWSMSPSPENITWGKETLEVPVI